MFEITLLVIAAGLVLSGIAYILDPEGTRKAWAQADQETRDNPPLWILADLDDWD